MMNLMRAPDREAFDARFAADADFSALFDPVLQGALLPKKVALKHNLGFFEDVNCAVYHLKTDPELQALAIHPFLLEVTPADFGLRKQMDAAVVEKLDAALRKLEANVSLAKMRASWVDVGGK